MLFMNLELDGGLRCVARWWSEVCSTAESSLSNFVEQLFRTYRYFQQQQFAICRELNWIEKYD